MLIQSVQVRAPEAPESVSRPSGNGVNAAPSGTTPADSVVVSEQGRALSRLAAQEGPELQLSPERLRALMKQVATSSE